MVSDELKFMAASVYCKLGNSKKSDLFLKKIPNLSNLIRLKQNNEFTQEVIRVLAAIDQRQHDQILLEHPLPNNLLQEHVSDLLAKKNYVVARNCVEEYFSAENCKKQYFLALLTFEKSQQTNVLETLRLLLTETQKDLAYWLLLYRVLLVLVNTTQYAIDEKKN